MIKSIAIRNFIRKTLNETMSELTLLHGSGTRDIITKFNDNQFFTINDYIASNYAYNNGGYLYEVVISSLHPFELKSYHSVRQKEEHDKMITLLKNLYNEDVANHYERYYFTPSPSTTFGDIGYEPIISWAKKNGYDSLKFIDESYDTFIHDVCYIVFNGSSVQIKHIYDIDKHVESNFSIKPILIK